MTYRPRKGDRVRVTRYRPDGKVHFVKTGVILSLRSDKKSVPDPYCYEFEPEDGGCTVFLATPETLAEAQRGWTQTVEPASKQGA